LHFGAHRAEELQDYEKYKWGPVIWVEAQPLLVDYLRQTLNPKYNTIIEAAAWSKTGEVLKFNLASNGQSSSLLEFGSHAENYPTVKFIESIQVTTTRLDDLFEVPLPFNFINLDIQGAELEALKGLELILHEVNWIYTEVNRKEVYVGCATIDELDNYLGPQGFNRIATRWVFRKDWGDALYVREEAIRSKRAVSLKNIPWVSSQLARYCLRKILTNLGRSD
jgi:FkbM family methyltransferase